MKLIKEISKNKIEKRFPKNFLKKTSEFLVADDRSIQIKGLKGGTFNSFNLYSNEPLPLYSELKKKPEMIDLYKKEEKKHLSMYKFLYDKNDTYFFDAHFGYYFLFRMETLEEYLEICLLSIMGKRNTAFLYGKKLMVVEGIDYLRINFFYPNIKVYKSVKEFALDQGFLVFNQ